jgi:hypothetical protein
MALALIAAAHAIGSIGSFPSGKRAATSCHNGAAACARAMIAPRPRLFNRRATCAINASALSRGV